MVYNKNKYDQSNFQEATLEQRQVKVLIAIANELSNIVTVLDKEQKDIDEKVN